MDKLFNKIKNFYNTKCNCNLIVNFLLIIIPLISIVFKGVLFQAFVTSQNPYDFNLNIGYSTSKAFLTYYIAFAAIFLSFSLLFKRKGRIIYIFIVDLIITALILCDLGYFRGFLTMPSALLLLQTSNVDNLGSSMASMFTFKDLLFFSDFIILGIFVFVVRNIHSSSNKRAIKSFIVLIIASISYIAYVPFNLYILGNEDVKNGWIFSNYDPTNTAKYFSSVGYHVFDLYTVYKDSKPYELTNSDENQLAEFFKDKKENLPNNEYYDMFKGKNLLVIQVESLESFVIGKEINGNKITPVMDKLIDSGIYFPNIYEQVNEGTSSDSDLMINTSMFPLRRGSTFFRYPNTTYNSLPSLLEEQGYETAAIHPDKGSFWNYVNGLKGIGFNNFVDYYSFNINEEIGMGLSDRSYFEQVVPMLKKMSDPFYAFTVTLTNHGPFDLPEKYRTLGLDKELGSNKLGGYFESVKYTDTQIGMFLDLLDKSGILDNTVVVIEGDHAGVHKYYNNDIDKLSKKEDWYLDNGNHTIPFIIWSKGINAPKKFDTIGGQIDIMPTLLYAMGVPSEKYENTAFGRNLLNTNKSFAVLTNLDIVENGLSNKEKEMYINSVELSDKLIRSDYFKK